MVGSAQADPPKRVALVVGNDGYRSLSPLHNPALDARTLATILDANGFVVIKCDGQRPGCFDLTREGLLDALDKLRERADGAELALVFYSGHGMETKADGNVLAPVDMEVVDCATRALRRSVPLESVFKAMAGARQKIVVLDACRNDPFAQCPKSRGFAPVSFGTLAVPAESFMLVASTKPGDVADDGFEGAHSPFARALVYWLEKAPEVHFHQLFQVHVTHRVIEETRGGRFTQLPETRMIGPPPEGCLKGAGCVGDLQTAALAQDNEKLKAQLARDQELGGTVRDYLAEAEKARGRPLSEEEKRTALEELKVATRDIAARGDTRGERALQRLKEGDPAEAERLFAEELESETKAAAERNVRAAKAARNLAALARPTNVAKAAEYYKRATDLDPTDVRTWLNYGGAAWAAGHLDEAKAAFEQAPAKARDSNDPRLLFGATIRLGEVAYKQGGLQNARQFYETALAMAESRAAERPEDLGTQHNLSVAHSQLGFVFLRLGNLSAALENHKAALTISERLVKADPNNTAWQRGLASSHFQIAAATQDNLSALESTKAALVIIERLAKADPSNAGWQLYLSSAHSKVGYGLSEQGDLPAALESYKAALAIDERHANADPSNTSWQHELSDTQTWLGDLLLRRGDLTAALESYKAAVTIKERLAKVDPSNASWQRYLARTHSQIGEVFNRQGNLPAALESYKAALTISERLAKVDPGNIEVQRVVQEAYRKTGGLLWATGNRAGALANYHKALAAAEARAASVEAQEIKSTGKPGSATARALGLDVAWSALFARDFYRALAATERARMLVPDQIEPDINRAHALLFLKRTREAMDLYLGNKGKMVIGGLGENVIANDFEELRKGGLETPQMSKIETRLGVARR